MRGMARAFGFGAACALAVACGRFGFDGVDPAGDGDGDGDADASVERGDSAVSPSIPRTWAPAATLTTPGAVLGGKLVYYPPNQSLLLYGGTEVDGDVATSSAAMWEYAGGDWSRICDPCGPGERVGHEYVYDVTQRLTLMFGGSDGADGGLADVWHYGPTTDWRVHTTTGTGPAEMVNFAAVYDVARGVNVVITQSNEVFELDGTVWSGPLGTVPGERSDQGTSSTYDAERGGVVIYGGATPSGDRLDDAWLWDGSTWAEVCVECTGKRRTQAAVAYDTVLKKTLIVGGTDIDPMGGTWVLGEPQAVDDAPVARASGAIAYDLARDVVVLFGGVGEGCPGLLKACDETFEMTLDP